jgi:hypothetical protein
MNEANKVLIGVVFGLLTGAIVILILGCSPEIPTGTDITINGDNNTIESGDGDMDICQECEEEMCEHPEVTKSCGTSVGENPTSCHGGVEPSEPVPEEVPCGAIS